MALTAKQIRSTQADDELLGLLLGELKVLFPPDIRRDPAIFLSRLQSAPVGLRAMAVTYELDVSMAMDDLAWHFVNHHASLELAEETLLGLQELGAPEAANFFAEALAIIKPHWQKLQAGLAAKTEHDWLDATGIQGSMNPLNDRLWNYLKRFPDRSFFSLWTDYARKHPERCIIPAQ